MQTEEDRQESEEKVKEFIVTYSVHSIDIEKIAEVEYNQILLLHPIDAMEQIDIVFNALNKKAKEMREKTRARKKQPKRLYIWSEFWHDAYLEYGRWSHIFNKAIRKNISEFEGDKDVHLQGLQTRYKYVYAYWWNRQHYITNIMKKHSGIWGQKATRNLEKGRKALAGLIKGDIDINSLPKKFAGIIDALDKQGYKGGHDEEFEDA